MQEKAARLYRDEVYGRFRHLWEKEGISFKRLDNEDKVCLFECMHATSLSPHDHMSCMRHQVQLAVALSKPPLRWNWEQVVTYFAVFCQLCTIFCCGMYIAYNILLCFVHILLWCVHCIQYFAVFCKLYSCGLNLFNTTILRVLCRP